MTSGVKESRIHLRVTPELKKVATQYAATKGTTLTELLTKLLMREVRRGNNA